MNGQSAVYKVYTLSCPIDNQVKYVGVSKNPHKRLIQHCSQLTELTKKVNWIKNLKSKELKPMLEIIDSANSIDEVSKLEIHYIKKYGDICELKNSIEGGYGEKPIHFRHYSKEKIKEVCKLISQNFLDSEIYKITNVNKSTISSVRSMREYKNVSCDYFSTAIKSTKKNKHTVLTSRSIYTKENIISICSDINNFYSNKEISVRHNISLRNISAFRSKQNLKNFTEFKEIPSSNNMLFKLFIIIEFFENNKEPRDLFKIIKYKSVFDIWKVHKKQLWKEVYNYYINSTTIEQQRIKDLLSRVGNKLLITETGSIDNLDDYL